MNNYDIMLRAAQQRFTGYDMVALAKRPGVEDGGAYLYTTFFSQKVAIHKSTGAITVAGQPADFGQTLSILDWLCDRRENAAAAEEFCPVGSLPRVYVSGSNLVISGDALAQKIHHAPDAFRQTMAEMGAKPVSLGDLGFQLQIFPDLPMCLKFYFGDEEFPPQLTLLWDQNILQFVRYETVYYIAGCLLRYLSG